MVEDHLHLDTRAAPEVPLQVTQLLTLPLIHILMAQVIVITDITAMAVIIITTGTTINHMI